MKVFFIKKFLLNYKNKVVNIPEKGDLKKKQRRVRERNSTGQSIKEKTFIVNLRKKNTQGQEDAMKKLIWVSIIAIIFMTGEFIGGYIANSTAIMSDAAHMLSDFLGFGISMISIIISKRAPTSTLSYGYVRAEILGALVSVV